MELHREHLPPPAYHTDHDHDDLKLPAVPTHDVKTPASKMSPITLPDLRSLGLPDVKPASQADSWSHHRHYNASNFPSIPATTPRGAIEPPLGSPMTTESVVSLDERSLRAPSIVSMDDIETRMAAEALSGLRNPELLRSPSSASTSLSTYVLPRGFPPPQDQTEEPLLSLVTANHPWLGGTINGSVAAYNTTKYYSPAFVRNGAEFVERTIGSPIASTFASVSRKTGVEGGVRRYLGERRLSDMDGDEERRRKRVRENSPEQDVEKGMISPTMTVDSRRSRAGSQASFQSLPPYDEIRSPRYEELASTTLQDPTTRRPLSPSRNWRTQLMITTSGLGAALSDTSLRNLRYCLGLLKGATGSITTIMVALKRLLDEYEESRRGSRDGTLSNYTLTHEQDVASIRIAEAIKTFHHEIMKTLENIKNSISHYTGSALPDNAGALVRRQLMSIPQRWRAAESDAEQSRSHGPQNETVKSGNKLVAFAGQSLEMLAQVTMVVGATIQNAEGWLTRMGRRQQGETSQFGSLHINDDKAIDAKMTDQY